MQNATTSKLAELLRWFGEHGGYLHEDIQLIHNSEYGYHYVAEGRPIEAKETVCHCPFGLTLSHLNVMQDAPIDIVNCSDTSICANMLKNLKIERSTTAIFFLIEQRLKAKDSFWFPYIQLLPDATSMTTPLWFGDDELVYLRGTNLLSNDTPLNQTSVGLQQESFRKQWELGVRELESVGESREQFSWDLFRWGATIFSSRAFTSDIFTETEGAPFPILYPSLDIFNHRLGAEVSWQLEGGNFTLSLKSAVKQGQQIFNNYSPKGNEDLLMGFGFCIEDNPYDRVAVRLGQVEPKVHARLHERIPSHWRSDDWNPEESVFYIPTMLYNEGESSCTYGIPNLACLNKIPVDLTKSIHIIVDAYAENAVFEDASTKEKQVWASTIDLLLNNMEGTLKGIQQWDSVQMDCPSSAGGKAALVYREGQVKILESVISDLKVFIDPLRNGIMSIEDRF